MGSALSDYVFRKEVMSSS